MAQKQDKEHEHNLLVLKSLNEAIETGPWDKSLFFQAMRNKLIEIRERFKHDMHLVEGANVEGALPSTLAGRIARRTGLVEIFVMLYNAQGINIPKWEHMLGSINSYIVSRPIYRNEQDAKAALRAATDKQKEAYVAIYIQEEDILEADPGQIPHDRFGKEILLIREGAIHKENITRFLHISGKYEFENNKLVWEGTADFL